MDHSSHRLSSVSKFMALGLWSLVVVATYFMLKGYIEEERELHLKRWEQRLSVVAYAQAEQIGEWLAMKQRVIESLAEDMSLRLYLSTTDDADEKAAQQTYLRNYILTTARQAGFVPHMITDGIRANVSGDTTTGLAVLDHEMNIVVSTSAFPKVAELLSVDDVRDSIKSAQLLKLTRTDDQKLALKFAAPIYPVQGDERDEPIGHIVAAIGPEMTVFPYLTKGEAPESPARSVLLQSLEAGGWKNVSALWDGRAPMSVTLGGGATETPASALAAEKTDRLIMAHDILHAPSLAFGTFVPAQNWVLVRRVAFDDAFADLESRMTWLNTAYWLLVATISLLVLALWRHVTADKLARLVSHIKAHEALLTLVTERIPARLFIADAAHKLRYANQAVADEADMPQEEVEGKSLNSVMGAGAAPYLQTNLAVLQSQEAMTRWHENTQDGDVISATEIQHIPLQQIPSKDGTAEEGVLVIEHDLTEVIRAKHATQLTLNKLIETLVMLVDTRDPNAAKHSIGVANIAKGIARAMLLDEKSVNTVEIAGRLMNVGKLLVPVDILTSEKELDAQDKAQIHESMQAAIEHLGSVPFEGPVVETLKQSQERPDGSGPLGLKEDAILETALILHAANNFVAITSPRAYREGKSIDETMAILQDGADREYARKVVSALAHYLDNLGGRESSVLQ